MILSRIRKFAFSFIASASLSAISSEAAPDLFLDVVVQNRFFQSSHSSPALQVRTREALSVDTLIYDIAGKVLACYPAAAKTQRHELVLTNLPPCEWGLYSFCLVARNDAGHQAGLYPTDPGGGEIIPVDGCRTDLEKKAVEYVLPRAALVRIRAGLKDGPYLEQILPWTAQRAGPHSIAFLAETETNMVQQFLLDPLIQATTVLAVSLPVNLLADQAHERGKSQPLTPSSGERQRDGGVALPPHLAQFNQAPWPSVFGKTKARFGVAVSEDYRLELQVKEDPAQPVASLRLNCHQNDRSRLLNKRFEIMLFVDGQFITEDEEALLPFNYRMSTRGIPPGDHLLTVNVVDSDGVPGTVSGTFSVSGSARGSP